MIFEISDLGSSSRETLPPKTHLLLATSSPSPRRLLPPLPPPKLPTALGLPSQFRTHHALLVLHTWLALLRLRKEGAQGAAVGQTLYDTFNHDVERRVVAAGVKLLVSKWMRELERSFYGAAAAYDAAVAPGASADALPKALWRNVFAEDASDMPSGPAAAPVQALTRYVRLELASLALTDSEAILTGNITFTNTIHSES
ncbi:unnamed protein product [Closterium sp. Yama58-4]|nr:unnamed protein product [Closterium sp. Yama58-4]